VALLKPNDLGMFDMHGNVFQWTHAAYNDKFGGKENDRGESVDRASFRVGRGGGWGRGAEDCRAAYRAGFAPDNRSVDLGFRLARVIR
jgi:formylglycine-generating enzyme required for sulfatase activity